MKAAAQRLAAGEAPLPAAPAPDGLPIGIQCVGILGGLSLFGAVSNLLARRHAVAGGERGEEVERVRAEH